MANPSELGAFQVTLTFPPLLLKMNPFVKGFGVFLQLVHPDYLFRNFTEFYLDLDIFSYRSWRGERLISLPWYNSRRENVILNHRLYWARGRVYSNLFNVNIYPPFSQALKDPRCVNNDLKNNIDNKLCYLALLGNGGCQLIKCVGYGSLLLCPVTHPDESATTKPCSTP